MADSDWKYVQRNKTSGKYRTTDQGGGGGGSSTFAGLDDVSFSDLQNGQVPKYNSETHKWENANESGGGGTVTDVEVDGVSVVNQQGVAEIEMPNVPVQDVQVDGTSVVNAQGVAEITMPTPPTPDYPVTDVKVNGTSVVSNKQALITSYKEVTQAQYEALPDTKLSDGILYAIKDGGQAVDGFPPLIYSSEEREIGVWTDGKPLYEKTYLASQSFAIPDMEVKFIKGSALNSSGIATTMPYNDGNVVVLYYTDYVDGVPNIFFYNRNITMSSYIITIQYTKPTDTPGSGTWNQQGAISHHYSTTEKVIGTWTDGKPLYEKSFANIELTRGQWTQIAHGIQNIGTKISMEGLVVRDSDGWSVPLEHYEESTVYIASEFSNTNIEIKVNISSGDYKANVVIRYTKTTD